METTNMVQTIVGDPRFTPVAGSAAPPPVRSVLLSSTPFASALGESFSKVLRSLFHKRHPSAALEAWFETDASTLQEAALAYDLPLPEQRRWRRGPTATRWSESTTRRLILWWVDGVRVDAIATDQGRKPCAIYAKARQLGLPKRDRKALRDAPSWGDADKLAQPLAAAAPAPAAPEPEPEPVKAVEGLLDWSDMIGAQAEPVQPNDVEDEKPAHAPGADAYEAKRKGKNLIPVPEACRGFKAPGSEAEFTRWLTRMNPNIQYAIRCQLLANGMRNRLARERERFEEAAREIYCDFLEWHRSSYAETPGVPRWTQYDPDRGLEFFQFITHQVRFKVLVYFERHNRDRARESVTGHFENDEAFESVVHNDGAAMTAMRATAIAREDVVDLLAFTDAVNRISEYFREQFARTQKRALLMPASFSTLLSGMLSQQQPDEIHAAVQHNLGVKVPNSARASWAAELRRTAKLYQEIGARAMLKQYGVPDDWRPNPAFLAGRALTQESYRPAA